MRAIKVARFIERAEVKLGDHPGPALARAEATTLAALNDWLGQREVRIYGIEAEKHSGVYVEDWFGSTITLVYEEAA